MTCNSDNIIDANTNIISLFTRLMDTFACTSIQSKCGKCQTECCTQQPVIPVPSAGTLLQKGFACLQQVIEDYISNHRPVFCHVCKEHSTICETTLGSYLCIDVEYLYQTSVNMKINQNLCYTYSNAF